MRAINMAWFMAQCRRLHDHRHRFATVHVACLLGVLPVIGGARASPRQLCRRPGRSCHPFVQSIVLKLSDRSTKGRKVKRNVVQSCLRCTCATDSSVQSCPVIILQGFPGNALLQGHTTLTLRSLRVRKPLVVWVKILATAAAALYHTVHRTTKFL